MTASETETSPCDLCEPILGLVSAPAIVLDETGSILLANDAWHLARGSLGEGDNDDSYFSICSERQANLIREIVAGSRPNYERRPERDREAFGRITRVTRVLSAERAYAIVLHEASPGTEPVLPDSEFAALALLNQEGVIRTLLNEMEDVFFVTDLREQRIVYVNAAYERVWGRSRASLYDDSRSFLAAVHPEDLDCVRTALQAQRAGQKEFREEYRIMHPGKGIRHMRVNTRFVNDDSGTP